MEPDRKSGCIDQTKSMVHEAAILCSMDSFNSHAWQRLYPCQAQQKNAIVEMFVLRPDRVRPMISESGQVFYELQVDDLSTVHKAITVPASEIIHDRHATFGHPLIGVSPLVAAALPVLQSKTIIDNSVAFHANASRPGGILQAPGAVSDDTVEQIRKYWSDNYTGTNAGKVAVLADSLSYVPFPQATAGDSQVFEQLGWTAETVCSVFGVPGAIVGIGEAPSYNNLVALNQLFYSVGLQHRIEAIEALLDDALRLPANLRVEFDLDGLLRMDFGAQVEALSAAVGGGLMTVNEARAAINKPAVPGGTVIFRQEQEWPLEQLANRRHGPDDSPPEGAKLYEILNRIERLAA